MTHQRHHLPRCDRILVLRGGRIMADGSFQQLQVCCRNPFHSTVIPCLHTLSACGTIAARQVMSALTVVFCTMPVCGSRIPCIKDDSAVIRTWDLRQSWAAAGSPLSWTTQRMMRIWLALGAPQLLEGPPRPH